jgi:hypothetical protein
VVSGQEVGWTTSELACDETSTFSSLSRQEEGKEILNVHAPRTPIHFKNPHKETRSNHQIKKKKKQKSQHEAPTLGSLTVRPSTAVVRTRVPAETEIKRRENGLISARTRGKIAFLSTVRSCFGKLPEPARVRRS